MQVRTGGCLPGRRLSTTAAPTYLQLPPCFLVRKRLTRIGDECLRVRRSAASTNDCTNARRLMYQTMRKNKRPNHVIVVRN